MHNKSQVTQAHCVWHMGKYREHMRRSFGHYTMKEGERGPFSPKLRVRIKDSNTSLHGKFRQFLFPFSSKFADQNFASYVLYIFPCATRSEPGLPVNKCGDLHKQLKHSFTSLPDKQNEVIWIGLDFHSF